ncbi:MAG: hypothetical protein E7214_03975 [Clostridium sp.]|nr:hypothetical protein [Clostridium sp.]
MSKEGIVVRTKLRYTSYELISSVEEKINEYKSIEEFNKIYRIDEQVLKEMLRRPKILTFEMYKIISKILGKTIKELTEVEKDTIITQFRGNEEYENTKDIVELANNIFDEIIINLKLRG